MAAGKGADLGKLQAELSGLDPRYELRKIIGAGSYGVVAKGVDKQDEEEQYDPQSGQPTGKAPRPCAVKKISKVIFQDVRLSKRILREVKLLAHFHEKSIGEDKAQYIIGLRNLLTPPSPDFENFWIAMELADSDMKSVLKSGQSLSIPQVQYMVYQMFHALNTMKACKVIHRDITPANVLVNYATLMVKICDFGLAREEPKEDDPYMTDYVTMRWYRAPELVMESKTYSEQVDIWGVGCIYGEMLGWGKPMFRGSDRINQLDKIIEICGSPSQEDLQVGSEAARKYVGGRYVGAGCKKGVKPRTVWGEVPAYARHMEDPTGKQAVELLDKMMEFHPDKRIIVEGALADPFIQKYSKDPRNEASLDVSKVPIFDFVDEKLNGLASVKKALYDETVQFHLKNPDTMTEVQRHKFQGAPLKAGADGGEARTGFEGTMGAGEAQAEADTEFASGDIPGEVESLTDIFANIADPYRQATTSTCAEQIAAVLGTVPSDAAKRIEPVMAKYGWSGSTFQPELSKPQCRDLIRALRESFK